MEGIKIDFSTKAEALFLIHEMYINNFINQPTYDAIIRKYYRKEMLNDEKDK